MNLSFDPFGFTEIFRYNDTNESRLVDRVRNSFVQIVPDPQFPSVEPHVYTAQVEVFGELGHPFPVFRAVAQEQMRDVVALERRSSFSRCHSHLRGSFLPLNAAAIDGESADSTPCGVLRT